jgi:hypothetical protein
MHSIKQHCNVSIFLLTGHSISPIYIIMCLSVCLSVRTTVRNRTLAKASIQNTLFPVTRPHQKMKPHPLLLFYWPQINPWHCPYHAWSHHFAPRGLAGGVTLLFQEVYKSVSS